MGRWVLASLREFMWRDGEQKRLSFLGLAERRLEASDRGARMQNYIVSSFYADSPGEESNYPGVQGLRSSSRAFHRVYYRCLMTLMASSVQCNRGARHVFVHNRKTLPIIDGVDCSEFLAALGVDVVTVPMTFAAPEGYSASFRATFYLLDVVEHVSRMMSTADAAILLDCDCLCVHSLDCAFREIREKGSLLYLADYPPDTDINGVSRAVRSHVFEEMSGRSSEEPQLHVGGEFLGLDRATACAVSRLCRDAWDEQLRRHTAGQQVLPTEEHVLSYVAWLLYLPIGGANRYCRRIWTSLRYRTATEADLSLPVWHLPAEKHYGLRRLWLALAQGRGPLLGDGRGNRLTELARYCGIPRRSLGKWIHDLTWRMVVAARGAIQRIMVVLRIES